jgi:DNA-binding transcriptional regulator YiaG
VDRFEYLHGDETVELQANVDVYTCEECGFEFTDSAAEDARHNAVCEFLGVMNPAEVKAVRNQYGFSRTQMASASKIGEASLGRWESGSLIQSGAYDNFLFLLRFTENMMRIQQRASGQTFESQIRAEKNWHSITVTETLRQEQAAFSLTPMAA